MSYNPYWKPRPASPETEPHLQLHRMPAPPSTEDIALVSAQDRPTSTRGQLDKAEGLMRFLFGVLTWLISLRMLLQFIGANPDKTVVRLTYLVTAPFMLPFNDIAPGVAVGPYVFDFSGLVAMCFYGMLTWVAIKLMWLLLYHPGAHRRGGRKTSEFRIK